MFYRVETDVATTLWGKVAFLCDFDGTISHRDVGDAILERYAGPSSPDISEAWRLGTLGSAEAYRRQYSEMSVPESEFDQLLSDMRLDPAFLSFFRMATRKGATVVVVSDGFDRYIGPLLSRAGIRDVDVYCNTMKLNTDRIAVDFPNTNPECGFCGNCKAGVVAHYHRLGFYTVYIGDGLSDRYPVMFADRVFAKGRLAEYCEREGISFERFQGFQDVLNVLERTGAVAGQSSGRRDLRVDPRCRHLLEPGANLGFLNHQHAREILR